MDKLSLKGKYCLEHIRDGKVIGVYDITNAVVDAGLNALLGIMFGAVTQVTTWYIGLIDNSGFTALSNADVMSSHAGWTEFTGFSESVRQTWGAGTATARTITNASAAVFSINTSGTLKGMFLASDSTKTGTTGTLWATAAFASNITVSNGDSARITYTVSG